MLTGSPQLPVWTAPLVPVALATTAGVVLDRHFEAPPLASLGIALVCLLGWLIFTNTSRRLLALIYLWCSLIGLGACWHYWQCRHIEPRDLSRLATDEPQALRLRGTLSTPPNFNAARVEALRSFATNAATRFVVRVRQQQDLASRRWTDVTGLVQVTVVGDKRDITVGDEVEMLGRLALSGKAMNPSDFDYATLLRDQGITTTLTVLDSTDVTLMQRGWPTSFFGLLAVTRGWGQATIGEHLGAQHEVASALLLGEGSGMSGEAWEQYQRTGVIHVLAISGQHLVVLAGFLWLIARVCRIRRRHAALIIALALIGYALLTGGRPPVMRAAWVVAIYCGGILLQRPASCGNTFAAAWLGVLLLNPADIFNAGCQLSFLAVAVLMFGVGRWADAREDNMQRAINEARPWYGAATFLCLRSIGAAYAVNFAVAIAIAPLVAAHYHNVSPIALVIGPPVVLLTSLALLTGFLFLLFSWLGPVAWVFAWVTKALLFGCDFIVSMGQHMPGGYFFVADIPGWWLWTFYVVLLVGIIAPVTARWIYVALLACGAWFLVGIALQLWPHRPGELRCTFLAVGHGGCTVIETPNGRVIVYDAGATTGPDVTRRHIAPFLWSRGIRHIDDLVLSHGDLDHFNGVPQLADRFSIGRVVSTPTFAERPIAPMKKTLAALENRGLSVEVVKRGERWESDGVRFEVLHPPALGPTKNENARSLVLLVTHADWSLLLTGDLEDEGLAQVLAQEPPRLDVLMAPHHGSDRSNIETLAKWARPKIVVSSQKEPQSPRRSVAMYEKMGARFFGTWPDGAITIRPDADEMLTTFRTKLSVPARR